MAARLGRPGLDHRRGRLGRVWAHEQGRVTGRFPTAAVLAVAAAGLALAVGLGVAAIEHDAGALVAVSACGAWSSPWSLAALAVASVTLLEAAGRAVGDAGTTSAACCVPWTTTSPRPLHPCQVGQSRAAPGATAGGLTTTSPTASTGAAVPGVGDLWPRPPPARATG